MKRRLLERGGLTAQAVLAGLSFVFATAGILAVTPSLAAQNQAKPSPRAKQGPPPGTLARKGLNKGTAHERDVKPTLEAAAAGDRDDVIFNWMWYMGMLRESNETDHVATFELLKSTGTVTVNGQPCKLDNYRISYNYQYSGMRREFSCTLPNGQAYKNGEVVAGQYSWDEDMLGGGLEPGHGTATPKPDTLEERQIALWASPQGSAKAAFWGGDKTEVSVENGKAVVTYPIPGIADATAKATLNSQSQAEDIVVTRPGKPTQEFIYQNYGDYSPVDDRIDAFSPGHIMEKINGMTMLDINVSEIMAGNLYVVMPVPPSVGGKSQSEPQAQAGSQPQRGS